MWCVVVCDLENLMNEEALAHLGLYRQRKQTKSLRNLLYSIAYNQSITRYTGKVEINRSFALLKAVFDGEPVLFVNILGVFAFKKTVDPAVPLTNIFP